MSPERKQFRIQNIRQHAANSFDMWFMERETEFKNTGMSEIFELYILTSTWKQWMEWYISDMATAMSIRDGSVVGVV